MCLDETVLRDLAADRMRDPELSAALAHLRVCEACQGKLQFVESTLKDEATSVSLLGHRAPLVQEIERPTLWRRVADWFRGR